MAIAKYYIKRYSMIALIMNILTVLFLFIFQNFSGVYMLAALWVGLNAVVISLFMQNDLHARDRLTLLSSLPVSRVSYFLQTYLVGLLFALLPPVICILGHLSPHLLLTALECYVLATLAGVITGHNIVHLLVTLLLILLPFLLTNMVAIMLKVAYYGLSFDAASLYYGVIFYLVDPSEIPSYAYMTDCFVIIISFALALLAFVKAKREQSEEAIVFPHLKTFLVYFTSFLMTYYFVVMSLSFRETSSQGLPLTLYMIDSLTAGVIIFLIMRMIASSSIHIFNKQTLKSFLFYGLVYVLLSSVTFYDTLGISKKVPALEDVDYVTLSSPLFVSKVTFKKKDNIKHILAMQKNAITHRIGEGDNTLDYTYHLKNGKTIKRSYNWNTRIHDDDRDYKAVLGSKEMHQRHQLNTKALAKQSAMVVITTRAGRVNYDSQDSLTILHAYNKDLAHLSYEALVNRDDGDYFEVLVSNHETYYFSITKDYHHTIKVLKKDHQKYKKIKTLWK